VPQDGIVGPGTQQAIAQFQMQQQLPSTGMLDDNTVGALQAACSAQQAAPDATPPPPAPPQPPPALRQAAPQPPSPRQRAPNPPIGEVGENEEEFAPGGGEAERHRPSGRWVRHEGRIILLGV
jgi:peptidoglycan hydrolase-like protein with peptidoglycan-binding domain